MTNQVTTTKTFEEKLKDRIKDSIGDLITDEDLSKLVHRGVEDVFFKPRSNHKYTGYGSSQPQALPPLLHTIIEEALTPAVEKAVAKWFEEHPQELTEAIDKVVAQGVGNVMISAISAKFQEPLMNFQSQVYNKLGPKGLL